jgi:DNA repair ATPase RecN
LSQAALDALSESENSLLTQSGALAACLQELAARGFRRGESGGIARAGRRALRELQSELSRYADKVDVDPARLAELEERLNLIHSLKRKYGATLAEVIAFGDEARQNCNRSNRATPNWRGSTRRWKTRCGNFEPPAKNFPPRAKSDSATRQGRRQTARRFGLQAKQV